MKKFYLLLLGAAAVMTAGASSPFKAAPAFDAPLKAEASDEYLVFGYCDGFNTSVGAQGTLQALIGMTEETATGYAGSELRAVNLGLGTLQGKDITVFLTYAPGQQPFYTEKVQLKKSNGWNEYELSTPYTIEGKEFYIGYEVKVTTANSFYPIGVDYIPTTNPMASIVMLNGNRNDLGPGYGSLSIQGYVYGDNLPQYSAALSGLDFYPYDFADTPFSVTATVQNTGVQEISQLGFDCTLNGVRQENVTVSLSPRTLASGKSGTVTIAGLQGSQGLNEIVISLNTLNGNDNEAPAGFSVTGEVNLINKDDAFEQNVLVEEWTGNWCGWCVRGIVGMQYMEHNYGDKGFIGIAVHGPAGYGEPMYASSYAQFFNKYADGFPGCIMNRMYTFDPNTDDLKTYYNYLRPKPGLGEITVTASYDPDSSTAIEVDAEARFALDNGNANYRLAFVTIEDNVGPYRQSNYYSGGASGPMDGWEKEGASVSTTYNEVARYIKSVFGIDESLPTVIAKGETYTYSTTVPTTGIKDINNCSLVAMILDANTGAVVNSTKIRLGDGDAAVEGIGEGVVSINGIAGGVAVSGDYDACAVYGIDGRLVASASGVSAISLPAGIYIVTVTDNAGKAITKKLIVR